MYKIAVDEVTIVSEARVALCQCYTPGTTLSEEPDFTEKEVPIAELRETVATAGRVEIIDRTSEDGVSYLPFDEWLLEVDNSRLCKICAAIINRNENRTEIYKSKAT